MLSEKDDDPIMVKIRENATLIRYICNIPEPFPTGAFSREQLEAMLEEISGEADDILRHTGLTSLEKHFEDSFFDLQESRNRADDARYQPYSSQD